MRYNSWDDKPEELTIREAARKAAGRSGIQLEMPRLSSFADLRGSLLEPAYMTVISGHGGPRNHGGSEADMEAWRLSGKDNLPWVTVPDLLRKDDVIRAPIVFVAACHGRLSAWQGHLMPGALLIVTTHRVSYPAVKWMLTKFLPFVRQLEAERAAACCIPGPSRRGHRGRREVRGCTREADAHRSRPRPRASRRGLRVRPVAPRPAPEGNGGRCPRLGQLGRAGGVLFVQSAPGSYWSA